MEVGLRQMAELILDAAYILGMLAVLADLFARREVRARGLAALLGFLALPFLVANYTSFRPAFMMMVRDAIIQAVGANKVFRNSLARLSRESIASLLVDSPFNNFLVDSLYHIGMLLYGVLITLAIIATSAVSSFVRAIWKLITKR